MTTTQLPTVVVGAGPLGSATARHLAESGEHVVLIGPDDPNGVIDPAMPWSGWSDESRMYHAVDLPLPSAIMGRRARSRFADVEARSGVEFVTPHEAVTVVAGDPDSLPDNSHFDIDVFTSNAFDAAVPVERVEEAQLRELYPHLNFSPGAIGLRQPEGLILNPRRFVAAQLALFAAAGGERVRDRVVSVSEEPSGVTVETASQGQVRARKVVLAAGANINLDRLLPRQLEFSIMGLTVALARVAEDTTSFPTLMWSDIVSDTPYSGLIVPPIRYPDGHVYIKAAGGMSANALKHDRHEVESWLHAGGDVEGARAFQPVLEGLLPGLVVEDIVTRPCLITTNHAITPYIGQVSERIVVATEGDHGVTIGDEVGRLAADLTRRGEWTDSLPEALFTPRFV